MRDESSASQPVLDLFFSALHQTLAHAAILPESRPAAIRARIEGAAGRAAMSAESRPAIPRIDGDAGRAAMSARIVVAAGRAAISARIEVIETGRHRDVPSPPLRAGRTNGALGAVGRVPARR